MANRQWQRGNGKQATAKIKEHSLNSGQLTAVWNLDKENIKKESAGKWK
jgi:hypothetical protein